MLTDVPQRNAGAEFRDAAKAVSVALGIVRRAKNITDADQQVVSELEKTYLTLVRHAMLLDTANNAVLHPKLQAESTVTDSLSAA
jgi:hypothetical protein